MFALQLKHAVTAGPIWMKLLEIHYTSHCYAHRKECYGAENVKLPADKHSAWGVGRTEPDPAGNMTLDCGTIVPMGKPYNKQVQTSLLYNEYPFT